MSEGEREGKGVTLSALVAGTAGSAGKQSSPVARTAGAAAVMLG